MHIFLKLVSIAISRILYNIPHMSHKILKHIKKNFFFQISNKLNENQ
jgi:hypothetical protein